MNMMLRKPLKLTTNNTVVIIKCCRTEPVTVTTNNLNGIQNTCSSHRWLSLTLCIIPQHSTQTSKDNCQPL